MCKFFEDEQKFPLSYFQGKRILELGSGVGLLGIAIASLGVPIVLTEQKSILEIFQLNVKQNILSFRNYFGEMMFLHFNLLWI